MATRIEIEVTSERPDGSFTWRAAGAKQPKGVFARSLLPPGAHVGDVLRAEAEFTVDGPELMSLTTIKVVQPDLSARLEVIGTQRPTEAVTTQLANKGREGRRDGRSGRFGGGERAPYDRPERAKRDDSRSPRSEDGRGSGGRGRPSPLKTQRTHRNAWIATLPEGHRPIAEQLMHEGHDGVSGALTRQNNLAVSEGRAPIDIGPVMRIADTLLPALQVAEWRDQADAAISAADSADLRELRRVLISGDAFSSDPAVNETLALVRSKVNRRESKATKRPGHAKSREAIAEGRVVRALRHSGRPAKAGVPLPADLIEQLSAATMGALGPDEEPHRWTMVLEALAGSPIRRLIAPEAKPVGADKDDELLDTVDRLAHRLPGIAELFGIEVKPERRPARRPRS